MPYKKYPTCCICDKITLKLSEAIKNPTVDEISIFCSINKKRVCVKCAYKISELLNPPKIDVKTMYRKKSIPPDIRWVIWKRDNFTCKKCGSREHLTIDHIYPEFLGGTLDESNLQTLCKKCNISKGIKHEKR